MLLSLGAMPTIIEREGGSYLRIPLTRMTEELREKLVGKVVPKVLYANDPIYGLPNEGIVKKLSVYWMNNFDFSYSSKSKLINQQRFSDAVKEFDIPEKFKEGIRFMSPLINGDITLVKVKSVKRKRYKGDVFDLAVPMHNSFVGGNGIVFHNSYGWYIFSVIKAGSMNLAHTSELLGTPNAKFIGLSASDIKEYGLDDYTIKATERDIKRAKELLNYPWFQHKEWQKEIKLMIKMGKKAELEALSSKGLRFITNTYLPEKLEKKQFLP